MFARVYYFAILFCYHSDSRLKTELERRSMDREIIEYVERKRFRRPGRPMTPGKYVFDPLRRTFGYYIGSCPNCNAKVIHPKEVLPRFITTIHRQDRSLKVRLLRYLERKLST